MVYEKAGFDGNADRVDNNRSNIGNARVAGLQADLGLSDHQYQTGKHFSKSWTCNGLTGKSAHGDIRSVYPCRAAIESDPASSRSSSPSSNHMRHVGSCHDCSVSSQHLRRSARRTVFSGSRRRRPLSRHRPLSFRYDRNPALICMSQ